MKARDQLVGVFAGDLPARPEQVVFRFQEAEKRRRTGFDRGIHQPRHRPALPKPVTQHRRGVVPVQKAEVIQELQRHVVQAAERDAQRAEFRGHGLESSSFEESLRADVCDQVVPVLAPFGNQRGQHLDSMQQVAMPREASCS